MSWEPGDNIWINIVDTGRLHTIQKSYNANNNGIETTIKFTSDMPKNDTYVDDFEEAVIYGVFSDLLQKCKVLENMEFKCSLVLGDKLYECFHKYLIKYGISIEYFRGINLGQADYRIVLESKE